MKRLFIVLAVVSFCLTLYALTGFVLYWYGQTIPPPLYIPPSVQQCL